MKTKFFSVIGSLLFAIHLFAMDVSLTSAVFFNQDDPYLQIFTRFSAASIGPIQIDSQNVQYAVAALILIKKEGVIVSADKYILKSPVSSIKKDFWDLRTYQLEPGVYDVEYTFSDVQDEENSLNEQREIVVPETVGATTMSDILLMSDIKKEDTSLPFNKNGIYYEPLAYDLLMQENEALRFNAEVYRSEINEPLYLGMMIYEGFSGTFGKEVLKKFTKLDDANYIPIMELLPTKNLPSGEYHLTLKLIDAEKNQVLFKEKNFTLIQPIADLRLNRTYDKEFENSFVNALTEEELIFGLKALNSQVSQNMTATLGEVIKSANMETKRYFLYSYWSQITLDNPGEAYRSYMEVVRAVDNMFDSNVGYGFETDRGYIFLKYGRPNDIIEVLDEPSAPPYAIWVYNNLQQTNQSNVKFLFYNPSLSGENYELLHSSCIGEISNPQWEQILYSSVPNELIGNSIDGRAVQDNFNRNARRYFEDN